MRKIRLYLNEILGAGIVLSIAGKDFEYLIRVMRRRVGDEILVFNGRDGEWRGRIVKVEKKFCCVEMVDLVQEQKVLSQGVFPRIALAFAPVKNVRIDFVASKATELGVTRFCPIITARTIVNKVNLSRFKANVKEAVEQCDRMDMPVIEEVIKLKNFLDNLEEDKVLLLCDESGGGKKISEVLAKVDIEDRELVIIIGPEGGFSDEEFAKFDGLKNLFRVTLGSRILRADTAAVAALSMLINY